MTNDQDITAGELDRRVRQLAQENEQLEQDNDELSQQIEQLQRTMQQVLLLTSAGEPGGHAMVGEP